MMMMMTVFGRNRAHMIGVLAHSRNVLMKLAFLGQERKKGGGDPVAIL
jgi:hypothetical protein